MREWLPCATVCDWLARMTEQRRLAAIVLADVAGYSRLMGLDDSGKSGAAARRRVARVAILHGPRQRPTSALYSQAIIKTGATQ